MFTLTRILSICDIKHPITILESKTNVIIDKSRQRDFKSYICSTVNAVF